MTHLAATQQRPDVRPTPAEKIGVPVKVDDDLIGSVEFAALETQLIAIPQ